MFRRRSNKAETPTANTNRVGGAMDPLPLPLGDTVDSGMWYKKPSKSSTNRNASNRSVSSHDEPLMSHGGGALPYQEPHMTGSPLNDMPHRGPSSSIPPPPSIQITAPSQRADYPHQIQRHPQHTNLHHGKLPKSSQPPKHPSAPGPGFGTPSRPNAKTTGLISLLNRNDWSLACKWLDDDLKCARTKESVTLQGQATVATPLHVAICLGAPTSVVEKLLNVSPDAAKMADDSCGRVPLHWACISSAPPSVLRLLLGAYPKSPKVMDRASGRLPLHYMVLNATSIDQVNIILDAERRAATHKDDHKKTPQDLINESSNPLKRQIMEGLHNAAISLLASKKNERQHNDQKPPQEATLEVHEWDIEHRETMGDCHLTGKLSDHSMFPNRKAPGDALKKLAITSGRQSAEEHGDEDQYRGRGRTPQHFPQFIPQGHHRAPSPSSTARSAPEVWPAVDSKPAAAGRYTPENWANVEAKPADHKMRSNINKSPNLHPGVQHEVKHSSHTEGAAFLKPPPTGGFFVEKAPPEKVRSASRDRRGRTSNDAHLQTPFSQMKPPPKGSPIVSGQSLKDEDAYLSAHEIDCHHPSGQRGFNLQQPKETVYNGNTGPLQQPFPQGNGTNPTSPDHRAQLSPKDVSLDLAHGLSSVSHNGAISVLERDHYARIQAEFSANRGAGNESCRQSQGESMILDAMGLSDVQPPSAVVGQLLLDDMNSDIKSVEEKLARRKRILKDKIRDLTMVDLKLNDMRNKEESLLRQLESSQATREEQQTVLDEKRFRVSDLCSQIAHLQSELERERSEIERLHESLSAQEDADNRAEQELKGTREERGSLDVVRNALIQEKASLDREVSNCESELKSLQAIQQIAARGENM